MTQSQSGKAATRHAAVAELFEALEALMIVYGERSEADRVQRWNADAERVTGEIARQLCTARTRISSTAPVPIPIPSPRR